MAKAWERIFNAQMKMRMKWTAGKLTWSITLLAGLSACTSTFWDKEWQYDGIQKDIAETQRLRIVSTPPATVSVNDVIKGETPLTLLIPYSRSVVNALKNQHEKSFGGKTRIVQTERKSEEIVQSKPYVFRFQATGFHDLILPVLVPYSDDTLNVTLNKAGIINDIECKIRVEARTEYFDSIERIIKEHAVEGKFSVEEDTPVQIEGQNVYRQTFNLIVKDSIMFDALVNALLNEARKNLFVFDILDAKTEATFSTNVMDTGIEHIVRGRIRSGSILYFIQYGKANVVNGVQDDGRFAFKVRLSPGEKFVYLISKYKDILRVYKKVDVFSQAETEITEEAFAAELSISVESLRQMIK